MQLPVQQGFRITTEPLHKYGIDFQGHVYSSSTAYNPVWQEPQTWMGQLVTSEDNVMPLSNHSGQNYGRFSVPAPSSHATEPILAQQAHPPWPCDTSHAPCSLLHSPSQLVGQPVILYWGSPSTRGSTTGLVPYPGSTSVSLPAGKALNGGLRQSPEPDPYAYPFATVTSPGSSREYSHASTSNHHLTSNLNGSDMHALPTMQTPYALAQGIRIAIIICLHKTDEIRQLFA